MVLLDAETTVYVACAAWVFMRSAERERVKRLGDVVGAGVLGLWCGGVGRDGSWAFVVWEGLVGWDVVSGRKSVWVVYGLGHNIHVHEYATVGSVPCTTGWRTSGYFSVVSTTFDSLD